MSLGIAATALLTLISLLPFGLNTLREAGNKQTESRILESVVESCRTAPWFSQSSGAGGSPVAAPQVNTFFFDQTGTELEDAADIDCNYVVRVFKGSATSSTGALSDNQYLRQLKVRITDRPDGYEESLANDNRAAGGYRERSVWVALLDQTGPLATP